MSMREKKDCYFITLDTLNSPEGIEVMGHVGMDCVEIEMMFGSCDWGRAQFAVRAADGAGITPIIRLPTNPWVTKGQDMHLMVDMTRALGIGAAGFMFSPDTTKEVELALEVGKDWHRNIHIMPFADKVTKSKDISNFFPETQKKRAEEAIVMPLIEGPNSTPNVEEILRVDGLKMAVLAITDASIMLGHPFEYEHPEVWKWVDRAVKVADKQGIILGGNTGYQYQTPEDIAQRVKRLYDHGLRIFQMQSSGPLLQFFIRDMLKASRALVE